MSQLPVDLHIDLNSEDHTGLPWGLLDRAAAPGVIVEGNWIVVGSGAARAVAQIADAEGNVVRVRPPCPAQSPGTNDCWGTSLAERPHNPGRPAGLGKRRGVDQPPAGRRCIPRRLVRCLLGQLQQLCGLLGGQQSCVRQNHRRELREHRRPRGRCASVGRGSGARSGCGPGGLRLRGSDSVVHHLHRRRAFRSRQPGRRRVCSPGWCGCWRGRRRVARQRRRGPRVVGPRQHAVPQVVEGWAPLQAGPGRPRPRTPTGVLQLVDLVMAMGQVVRVQPRPTDRAPLA